MMEWVSGGQEAVSGKLRFTAVLAAHSSPLTAYQQ